MVVTDWNKNNWLDSRRITDTEYVDELNMLKLINQKYEFKTNEELAKPMLSEYSIEENRIDKNSIEENSIETTTNIYDYIESNFNRTLSPLEIQKIDEWLLLFNEEIIKYGVSIAVMNHKKTFSYVNGILKNWQGSGYTTLEEVKQEQREIKPSEKNKEIQELETYNWLEEGD